MKSLHSEFQTKLEWLTLSYYNKTIIKIHYASYQVWFLRLKYCNSKCSPLVNDLHSVWKKRWKSKIGDRLIRRRCTLCSSKWGAIPKHPLSIEDQVDIISYVVQLILIHQYKGNCYSEGKFTKLLKWLYLNLLGLNFLVTTRYVHGNVIAPKLKTHSSSSKPIWWQFYQLKE